MSGNHHGIRRVLSFVMGGIMLVVLMLYMGGFLTGNKIGPESGIPPAERPLTPERTVKASVERVTEFYEAVGTVRPRSETRVEAQVTARVLDILVGPGDRVSKGDDLIILDDRELKSRLDQAREGYLSAGARRQQAHQALAAAQAAHAQSESAYRRIKTYFQSEAATAQDLEEAESGYLQTKAGLEQAGEALQEAEAGVNQAAKVVAQNRISLGYARITASDDGEVVKRLAEPGDLAWPGKGLLVLQTRGALRLEALVREGLIQKVSPGISLAVVIKAPGLTLEGTVEEVVPSADPVTRTFLVKVALPIQKGLFPGMFGRLRVPVGQQDVVLVPRDAVDRIGQLEMVTVKEKDEWRRVFVKTGRETGERVEVLSGLKGGEDLALKGEP